MDMTTIKTKVDRGAAAEYIRYCARLFKKSVGRDRKEKWIYLTGATRALVRARIFTDSEAVQIVSGAIREK